MVPGSAAYAAPDKSTQGVRNPAPGGWWRQGSRRRVSLIVVLVLAGAIFAGTVVKEHQSSSEKKVTSGRTTRSRSTSALATTTSRVRTTTTTAHVSHVLSLTQRRLSGAFQVLVPASWRYQYAGQTGDHATYLYYDPADPLNKLQVIGSACYECVFDVVNGPSSTPDPAMAAPQGATTFVISPTEAGFVVYDPTNPDPDNGIVVLVYTSGGFDHYFEVDLYLPANEHATATAMLDSFQPLPLGSSAIPGPPPCTEPALYNAIADSPDNPGNEGYPTWTMISFHCIPGFASASWTAPSAQGSNYLFRAENGNWVYVTDGTAGDCQTGGLTEAQCRALNIY